MNNELIFKTNDLTISDTLKTLGVSPGLLGYSYLKEGVAMAMQDMSYVHNITKRLYPELAKRFNTTASRVERAIRHAIEKGWEMGSVTEANKLFGYSINIHKGKPTNGEFIATVADYLLIISKE